MRRPCLAFVAALGLCAAAPQGDEVLRRSADDGSVRLENVPDTAPELAARLDGYQRIRRATLADWTDDGAALWIRTGFGERTQVHRVDAPLGMRRQLSFLPGSVGDVQRRPRHAGFSFEMDERGREPAQLYLFDPARGRHRLLSDGRSRNGAALWSHDGKQLAYLSTARDSVHNDVWILDPERPGSAHLVLEADEDSEWAPADFSPDGRRLLLAQAISVGDSRVQLLDLETGELELVAGGGLAPGSYLGIRPTFTRDGAGVFLATDERGEFRNLARQDLASGERVVLSEAIAWDVEQFALSPDGTQAAFSVNADGLALLYLLETAIDRYKPVRGLPAGIVSRLRYAPDGKRLALTIDSPSSPSDVWVVRTHGEPTPERWTRSESGGLDEARFVSPQLVHYPTFDQLDGGPRHVPALLDLPAGKGPFPVVVWIHDGPEEQARPGFDATLQAWVAELGVAVLRPNVRGSTGYGKTYTELDNGGLREGAVRDISTLLDWIALQPALDARRVAVFGEGYGGFLALAVAVRDGDRLAAAVDVGGIHDLVGFLEDAPEAWRDRRRFEYGDERVPEIRELLDSLSPTRHALDIRVPLLIARGAVDPRVPAGEAEAFVAAVRAHGGELWCFEALDERHGFEKPTTRELFSQAVAMFLTEHLLPEPAER